MGLDVHALIAARATHYRKVQDRAGLSFSCLNPKAEATPITSVEAAGDDKKSLTVRVQGPIDEFFGFDVRGLIADLDKADPQAIHLLIESPGGFLLDGLALYSDLRSRVRDGVKVTAEARGVVASAAVLPFLAADERTMGAGTLLMVHEPYSLFIALGSADDIESETSKVIKALRASEKTMRGVMTEHTGQSSRQMTSWMKAETWFSPDEAVDAGFATAVIEDAAGQSRHDDEARALARRVMAHWKLNLRQEEAA